MSQKRSQAAIVLVIATVIIAVTAGFWLGNIASTNEEIDSSTLSISRNVFSGEYTIVFNLRNTGKTQAIIKMININGLHYDDASFTDNVSLRETSSAWVTNGTLNMVVNTSSSKMITLKIQPASGTQTVAPFTDGTRLKIDFYTVAGGIYPKTLILTNQG